MFEPLLKFDNQAFLYCVNFGRDHGLSPLAKRISKLGDGPSYLYITAFIMLLSDSGQVFFNLLLVAFAIELPLYFVLKNSIRRVRPCHGTLGVVSHFEPSDKFSLPSGHTAAAFVFATCVLLLFPPLVYLALSFALGVGLSRIVLGVHFPLDIVAGMVLGIVSALMAQAWVLA